MAKKRKKKQEISVSTLYKIAGVSLAIIFLAGIIYAVMTAEPEPVVQPAPAEPEPTPEPVPEPVIEPEPEPVINETNKTNITETPEPVVEPEPVVNTTNTTTPTVTLNATNTEPTSGVINYTWEKVNIEFSDQFNYVTPSESNYQYVNITEADGTAVANDEQFDVTMKLIEPSGRTSQILTNYENKQWLVRLLLTGKGQYQLHVHVTCAEKKGHCFRLYPEGSQEAFHPFEVQ